MWGSRVDLPVLVVLSVSLAYCTPDPRDESAVAVRDSAGVEIVEFGGDLWSTSPTRRLSTEPLLRVGVADGEAPYLFSRIMGVVQLSDGRLVVANGGDNTIRWFDAGGRFLFQRGGDGEGPGEFSRLAGLVLGSGDTIIAADLPARRYTQFAADGSLGAIVRVAQSGGPSTGGIGLGVQPGPVYPLADGSYITTGSGFLRPGDTGPRLVRVPTPLVRLAPDGSQVDTIGVFAGTEVEVRSGSFSPAPIGRQLTYATGPDIIYVATQDRFAIDVYSPSGQLLRSVRAPDVDLTLNVDAHKDSMRAQADVPPAVRALWEEQLDALVLPEAWPAFASFIVSTDGSLWVERRLSGLSDADSRPFAVLDPTGAAPVTVVDMPTSFDPMFIAGGLVIGRHFDGVAYVVVYTLEDESAR